MAGKEQEIVLDQTHFSPYVERLPQVNRNIKKVEKIDPRELNKKGEAYKISVETRDYKQAFLLGFFPDEKGAKKSPLGEHTIQVLQPLKTYENKKLIPEAKFEKLLEWWEKENIESILSLAILQDKYLCLIYEDLATAYLAEAIYDFAEEVINYAPKVLKKMKDLKLI